MEEDRYNLTHSCPQVDEAIGRALPGGAIDLSLSNKANQADVDASLSNNAADHPHRNLLDNWDFRNPVNQRGQTSYADNRYGIDRWTGNYVTVVTVSNGYITISGGNNIKQVLEPSLPNGTYTLSLCAKSASGGHTWVGLPFNTAMQQLTSEWKIYTFTATGIPSVVSVGIATGEQIDVKMVKLELGSVSTLANDHPVDKQAETIVCKRYFNLWTTEAARTAALLEVESMRTTPVLSTLVIDGVTYYTASADL